MIFMPESPRWLQSVRRKDDASNVLTKIRGGQGVPAEVAEIEGEIKAETGGSFSDLLTPELRLPLIIGIGLAILQQVTGVNTVIYYAPAIFKAAGLGSATASIAATAGIGVVNVAMTALAIWLLDKAGRKPLLLLSVAGMTIALAVLGLGFLVHADEAAAGGGLALITGVSLVVYIASFAIGMGPVFWLLIAEIYPIKTRAMAMSVATVANWAANYVVAATFLTLAGVLGKGGVFWLYGLMGLLTWFFVLRLVPETKGKTLGEIQEVFAARRARRPPTPHLGARRSPVT
jgi:sugar porter (SP) family MFS transporter